MNSENNKTILLVEDEVLIAMTEKMELEKYGYSIHHVTTGEKAVNTIVEEDFAIDLILMDINLGSGIDGTQAAEQILSHKDIPVVFLSSHTEPEVVEKTEKITSYGYVVKNSGIVVLDTAIKMALKLFYEKIGRKQAEKEQQIEKENLRVTLNSIGDAVISTEIQGRVDRMNPVAEELCGWTLAEAKGKQLSEVFNIVDSETRERVADPVKKVLQSGNVIGLANHTVLISKDGKEYQIADSAAPIKDKYGKIIGVVLVFFDVTEKYLVQKKLKESEEKYRVAFNTSPDSVNINRMDGLYVDINQGFTSLTGYTRQDVIGKLSSEIHIWSIPEDREKLVNGLKNHGHVENLESVFRCKDGSLKTALMSARVITINDQPHILSVTRDITERKRAEEDIKREQFFLSSVLNNIKEAIIICNENGEISRFNESARTLHQLPEKSIPAENWADYYDLYYPDGETPLATKDIPLFRALQGEDVNNLEIIVKPKKKTARLLSCSGQQIKADNGKKSGAVIAMHDITDRKQAEEEIKKQISEKEILLREVHHRVKNNIQNIESFLKLQDNATANPEAKEAINTAVSRVQSMRILYDNLLVSKDLREISIKNYIEDLIDSLQNVFVEKGNIIIKKHISDFSIKSKEAITIGIIINELLTNVFKYAFKDRDKGTVSVSIEKTENMVTVIIQDNGIGIDERILENKSPGFGLTIVKMLVEQLKGTYSIVNENGTRSVIQFEIFEI